MRATRTLLTPAKLPFVLLLLSVLTLWLAEPALARARELCVGPDLAIGPREHDSVLLALQRSRTFRREFLAARDSSRLHAVVRADVIAQKAHFEHLRPRKAGYGQGFCVEGTARVNVPSSPVEFAAQLGHELSHANSLQTEGCISDPGCKPPSHEVRARAVEEAVRQEWRRRLQWISRAEARTLLEGPAVGSSSSTRGGYGPISR